MQIGAMYEAAECRNIANRVHEEAGSSGKVTIRLSLL